MAAVFALVIIPLVIGLGFFAGLTHAEHTGASAAAAATFLALSTFVVVGILRVVGQDEAEADDREHHA